MPTDRTNLDLLFSLKNRWPSCRAFAEASGLSFAKLRNIWSMRPTTQEFFEEWEDAGERLDINARLREGRAALDLFRQLLHRIETGPDYALDKALGDLTDVVNCLDRSFPKRD